MKGDGAAEAMASDGVLPETLVVLVEAWPGSARSEGSGRIAAYSR
jgi:hypothetical protein